MNLTFHPIHIAHRQALPWDKEYANPLQTSGEYILICPVCGAENTHLLSMSSTPAGKQELADCSLACGTECGHIWLHHFRFSKGYSFVYATFKPSDMDNPQ